MKPAPRKRIIFSTTPAPSFDATMNPTGKVSLADKIFTIIKGLKPTRPMKYPYTFSAKIIQFPWRFYFENNRIWRYYPLGVLGSVPIFMYFSYLANSPTNKAVWAEKRRKEKEEHHHK